MPNDSAAAAVAERIVDELHAWVQTPARADTSSPGEDGDKSAHDSIVAHIAETLGVTFQWDDIDGCKAYIATDGLYRLIGVDRRVPYAERIAIYFHLMAHVALGHVASTGEDLRLEPWNPESLDENARREEYLANCWALRVVNKRLRPAVNPGNPFAEGALSAAQNLGVPRGAVRKLLRTLSGILSENAGLSDRLLGSAGFQSVVPTRANVRPEDMADAEQILREVHALLAIDEELWASPDSTDQRDHVHDDRN